MPGSLQESITARAAGLLSRWRRFAGASPLRRLGAATLLAAWAALGAKGVGFVREVVVASAFGLADGVDVYLMAFVVVGFPLSILLNAAQTALVAALAASRPGRDASGAAMLDDARENEAVAYGTSVAATIAIAVVLTPLWLFVADQALPWIASGFDGAKRDALRHALWLLVPYTILNAVNLLAYSVLQARHRFGVVGLLPALTPLAICAVVLARPVDGAWQLLAAGLILGTAIECLAVNWIVRRGGLRARIAPNAGIFRRVRTATRQLLPGTLFIALGPLAEQAIAAGIGSGTNSALGYGNRIPASLSGVLVVAVGATVLPHFSALIAARDPGYTLHSLRKLARWLFIGGSLGGLALAAASSAITSVVFERGAFDAASTLRVAPVQAAYFLQLPFALVAMVGLRTLTAAGLNPAVSRLTAMTIVLQISLAWILGNRFGAPGIAAAATAATAFSACVAFVAADRELRRQAA
jgi:putative peptidoglycan lipid II flippase